MRKPIRTSINLAILIAAIGFANSFYPKAVEQVESMQQSVHAITGK